MVVSEGNEEATDAVDIRLQPWTTSSHYFLLEAMFMDLIFIGAL
jgi:hypothetical protein